MKISLIVAVSENGVIGDLGKMPWKLSGDLKHFKELTIGKPVIMGRKTFESLGEPLPDRKNIILTRDAKYDALGCETAHDAKEAIKKAGNADEVMIIGGEETYRQFMPLADTLYLTRVHANLKGDAFFPEFPKDEWEVIDEERHGADEKNSYPYTFYILEKVWNKVIEEAGEV